MNANIDFIKIVEIILMPSNSNDNGRALEFVVVDFFINNHSNVILTSDALASQKRDLPKFLALPQNLKKSFQTAASKFFAWFNKINKNKKIINIDRFSDNSGFVYDLEINGIFFSLKHNHYALKHPRPYSLAEQCGLLAGGNDDKVHRLDMKIVSNSYQSNLNGITKYNQNKVLKYKLFSDVLVVCKNSLDSWSKKYNHIAFDFFNFIVGTNFYKIIVKEDSSGTIVEVHDFLNVPQPNSMTSIYNSSVSINHLYLKFNHGWEIDLRLHTARSKIQTNLNHQLSLKFDVQKKAGNIKNFQI